MSNRICSSIVCATLLLSVLSVAYSQGTREKRIQPVDASQRQSFQKQVKVALLVGIGAYR